MSRGTGDTAREARMRITSHSHSARGFASSMYVLSLKGTAAYRTWQRTYALCHLCCNYYTSSVVFEVHKQQHLSWDGTRFCAYQFDTTCSVFFYGCCQLLRQHRADARWLKHVYDALVERCWQGRAKLLAAQHIPDLLAYHKFRMDWLGNEPEALWEADEKYVTIYLFPTKT